MNRLPLIASDTSIVFSVRIKELLSVTEWRHVTSIQSKTGNISTLSISPRYGLYYTIESVGYTDHGRLSSNVVIENRLELFRGAMFVDR